jgi:mannose-6-phosphate isomerase-like protein (cupin superfamily)
MTIKNIGNAEHYTWGVVCDGWRLLNGNDLAVTQECIPSGHGEVKHYHARSRQLFYVLDGKLNIEVANQIFVLGKGDSLEIPPTFHHRVWNAFEEDGSFLVISAPTTAGDRVNLEPLPNSGI